MGEGLFQPLHLILIIAIALLVFGTGKFTAVGKGLGEGIRSFKDGMSGTSTTPPPQAPPQAPAEKPSEEKK